MVLYPYGKVETIKITGFNFKASLVERVYFFVFMARMNLQSENNTDCVTTLYTYTTFTILFNIQNVLYNYPMVMLYMPEELIWFVGLYFCCEGTLSVGEYAIYW